MIDTHLRPVYEGFIKVMKETTDLDLPHSLFALAGVAGLIFCTPNDCKQLAGVAPRDESAIKRHVVFLVNIMVPEPSTV
jgi:hypothetical protein